MSRRLNTPEQFESRNVRIVTGIIGMLLTYAVVTRALDTGSWWQYLFTLVLLVLSTRLIMRGIKSK